MTKKKKIKIIKQSELPLLDKNSKELIAEGRWSLFKVNGYGPCKYLLLVPEVRCGHPHHRQKEQRYWLDKDGDVIKNNLVDRDIPLKDINIEDFVFLEYTGDISSFKWDD